jgi:hypothetical protein
MSNYLIDIDGTICEDISNEESHRYISARVFEGAVDWVNCLYAQGHQITFFTARESKDRLVTLDWLETYGFRFHSLLMDKPRGGDYVWVDNLDVMGVKYEGSYDFDKEFPANPRGKFGFILDKMESRTDAERKEALIRSGVLNPDGTLAEKYMN